MHEFQEIHPDGKIDALLARVTPSLAECDVVILSDYVGRRPVLFAATLLQSVAMVVFATAGGVSALLAARIARGSRSVEGEQAECPYIGEGDVELV